MSKSLLLVPDVLNTQVYDKDGVRCGKVDDILLEGEPGKTLKITGIIIGVEAWTGHAGESFFTWLIKLLFRNPKTRTIPVSDIQQMFPKLKLKKPASEESLGSIDSKLTKFLKYIPGA